MMAHKKNTFMQKKNKQSPPKKITTKNSKMPKIGKDRVEVGVPIFLAVVSSLLK